MGLDMFLTKKKYIGGNYEHNKIHGIIDIYKGEKRIPIDLKKTTYIEESVGYWRKANAIHKWFVDNVQGGNDDCRDYYVHLEQLKELLEICKKIDKNHNLASELLPTTIGFFFGSTDYDDWYYENIKETIKILEKAIKEEEEYRKLNFYGEFYYTSSW